MHEEPQASVSRALREKFDAAGAIRPAGKAWSEIAQKKTDGKDESLRRPSATTFDRLEFLFELLLD
jgi:hypothetical protein